MYLSHKQATSVSLYCQPSELIQVRTRTVEKNYHGLSVALCVIEEAVVLSVSSAIANLPWGSALAPSSLTSVRDIVDLCRFTRLTITV